MNNSSIISKCVPGILACGAALALTTPASAMESDFRIIPQITAGTAGVEPGVALEWRGLERTSVIIRPEVFVSEDGDIGAGAAILYDVSQNLDLPKRQAIAIGPRVVYHNSDQYSWEADAMATWSFDLVNNDRAWQHAVGVLGAIGIIHDKDDDDNDLGASAGIFYSYGF